MSTQQRIILRDADIKRGPIPADVLAYWRQKKLKPSFSYADTWNEEHSTAFSIAKVMREDVLEVMQEELDRAIVEGVPYKQWAKQIRPRLKDIGWWDKHEVVDPKTGKVAQVDPTRRLKLIYDTNVRTSRQAAQWQRAQRTKKSMPYLLYGVGPSEKHRPEHLAWHGLMLPVDDEFWLTHMPSNGHNCFLPNTRVTGEIKGASKAWYEGEAVELVTESGATLSVTPNHPVATARGWVRAGDLRVGDDCVSHRGEVELARRYAARSDCAVRDNHVPSRIQDVFDSLALHRRGTAKAAPLDFHGEAKRFVGEVEVVGSYVQLVDHAQSPELELFGKHQFSAEYPTRPLVHGLGPGLALAVAASPAAYGLPGASALNNGLLSVHLPPSFVRRFGAPAHVDATMLQKSTNESAAYAVFLGELEHGCSREISRDKLVSVRRFPYSGHVYDLESSSGWILADGLVASNCKCFVRSISKFEADDLLKDGILGPEPEPELDDDGLPTGHLIDKRMPIITTAPPLNLQPWKNARTGKTEMVPAGIQPGFHHLPGETRRRYLEEHGL